ncbi:FkbM family methyltransferase [Stenotrophomonas sp.]|uniref:FkbM family methyltransferase n=1 Tax=Stenotrophomonas sp. TaxID=69392 RepID=UPI00289B7C3B|nr:FkbM family methyltransferase [Stenotrophomonas sp.]
MKSTVRIGDRDILVESDDTYLAAIGREFEPAMVELFKTFIEPEMVVVDIGGNIGLTALLFSSLAKDVHVFEPSPSTHTILERNLANGSADNVTHYNLGLASEPGAALITRAKDNRSGAFVSDAETRISGHVSESIQLDTLDAVCRRHGIDPDFIKIDVEGFEESVLRGGTDLLAQRKGVFVMELNHGCLNILHRKSVPDYIDYLRSVFPNLYAVDTDNLRVRDMHDESQAYSVMHEHVMRNRYPNLVGGFSDRIMQKLDALVVRSHAAPITDAAGDVRIVEAPVSVQAGEVFRIRLVIDNQSGHPWLGTPSYPLNLSYHWLDAEGTVVVFDGVRTPTPSSGFTEGSSSALPVDVVAPDTPGTYWLLPTLVQEGIAWLEARGLAVNEVAVTVLD